MELDYFKHIIELMVWRKFPSDGTIGLIQGQGYSAKSPKGVKE